MSMLEAENFGARQTGSDRGGLFLNSAVFKIGMRSINRAAIPSFSCGDGQGKGHGGERSAESIVDCQLEHVSAGREDFELE